MEDYDFQKKSFGSKKFRRSFLYYNEKNEVSDYLYKVFL